MLPQYLEQALQIPRGGNFPWLDSIRHGSADWFREVGIPTRRHEEWLYTSLAPITGGNFRVQEGSASELTTAADAQVVQGAVRIDCVNGFFVANDVNSVALAGVTLSRFSSLNTVAQSDVEALMAKRDLWSASPMAALSTALVSDGLLIDVAPGTKVSSPIQIVHRISSGSLVAPRLIVRVGEKAEIDLVQTFVFADAPGWYVGATDVTVGNGAKCQLNEVVTGTGAVLTNALSATVEAEASFHSLNLAASGLLARNNVNVKIKGERAHVNLKGLYVGRGSSVIDNHVVVDHAAPASSSRQLFKGILDDKSRGVFSGTVIVRQVAQKTDAKQLCRTLLLSDGAETYAKPILKIEADDVKCGHGATVGQLNEDEIFYMRSRGISRDVAEAMLSRAFAREVTSEITSDSVRATFDAVLNTQLATRR